MGAVHRTAENVHRAPSLGWQSASVVSQETAWFLVVASQHKQFTMTSSESWHGERSSSKWYQNSSRKRLIKLLPVPYSWKYNYLIVLNGDKLPNIAPLWTAWVKLFVSACLWFNIIQCLSCCSILLCVHKYFTPQTNYLTKVCKRRFLWNQRYAAAKMSRSCP